jgi:hypothetical protein
LLIGLALSLTLSSCATVDYSALESRVTALEKKKATTTMLLAEQAGARKFWWRNALTEGADALDAISHLLLADGDAAFVMTLSGETATGYLYVYDENGTTAESSPLIIAPDSGGGRWFLVNFNGAAITSNAAEGTHYVEVTNAGDLAAGSRGEGRCWYDTTNHVFKCVGSDGSTVQTIGP